MQLDYNIIKKNSELRQSAREQLKGNWGTGILLCLIFSIIYSFPLFIPIIGPIICIILVGPLILGLYKCFLKLARHEPFIFENLFDGFKNFSSAVLSQLLIILLVWLWSLLLIVPGIIAVYRYSLVFYILNDNPNIGVKAALNSSKKMMVGFKWKLFCLQFSFIGWSILASLSLCIGYLWLIPYMFTSFANFYENIKAAQIKEDCSADPSKSISY